MPVLVFGERKNGWPKSPGLSSIQTLSSFCQSENRPSMRVASLTTSANGRRPLAAARAAAVLAGVLRAVDAAAAGLAGGASVALTVTDGNEAQPLSKARQHSHAAGAIGRDKVRYFIGYCRKENGRHEASFVPPCCALYGCDSVTNIAVMHHFVQWGCPSWCGTVRARAECNYFNALKRTRLGRAPSSPRRFFLSASYSW